MRKKISHYDKKINLLAVAGNLGGAAVNSGNTNTATDSQHERRSTPKAVAATTAAGIVGSTPRMHDTAAKKEQ